MDQKNAELDSKIWLFLAGYRWFTLSFVVVALAIGVVDGALSRINWLVFIVAVAYTLFITLGWKFLPKIINRHLAPILFDFCICLAFLYFSGVHNSLFLLYSISPVIIISITRGLRWGLALVFLFGLAHFFFGAHARSFQALIDMDPADFRILFSYLATALIFSYIGSFQRQLRDRNDELTVAKDISEKTNRDLESANRQLLALQTISTTLQSSLDLSKVVMAVINGFKYSLDFNRVIFAVVDEETDALTGWVVVGGEKPMEYGKTHEVFLTARSPVMRLFDSGRPIDDSDPNYRSVVEQLASCLYVTPRLIVPLGVGEKPVGIIVADRHENGRISQEDLSWLKLLATQAAVAINNAKLHTKMQNSAVLSERNRIAMEIHDGLFQTLSGARLILESCNRLIQSRPEAVQPKLMYLDTMLGRSYEEMRYSISNLRLPFLASDNFAAFLRQTVEEFSALSGIDARMKLRDSENIELLSEDVKFCLYRIVQESLSNVRKHARATTLAFYLGVQEGQVLLRIVDDGRGFSVEDALRQAVAGKTFGIVALKSRVSQLGGELLIESNINQGSRVLVSIPYPSPLEVNLDNSSRR